MCGRVGAYCRWTKLCTLETLESDSIRQRKYLQTLWFQPWTMDSVLVSLGWTTYGRVNTWFYIWTRYPMLSPRRPFFCFQGLAHQCAARRPGAGAEPGVEPQQRGPLRSPRPLRLEARLVLGFLSSAYICFWFIAFQANVGSEVLFR